MFSKLQASNAAIRVADVPLRNVFNLSVPANEHFLQFILTDSEDRVVSTNYLFPAPIKNAQGVVGNPLEITIESSECDRVVQTVRLRIRATAPVIFFYIDVLNEGIQEYQLSDNGFMIVEPITTVTITYPNAGCAGNQLRLEDLRVYTVNQFMNRQQEGLDEGDWGNY